MARGGPLAAVPRAAPARQGRWVHGQKERLLRDCGGAPAAPRGTGRTLRGPTRRVLSARLWPRGREVRRRQKEARPLLRLEVEILKVGSGHAGRQRARRDHRSLPRSALRGVWWAPAGTALHDEDLAEAIVDRILERGRLLRLDGPSVRTKHLPADVLSDEGQQDSIVARVSGKPAAEFPERTAEAMTIKPKKPIPFEDRAAHQSRKHSRGEPTASPQR